MTELLASAKINLFLLVGACRDDGYHPVCSLMEKVSLYDRLTLHESANSGVTLAGAGLPAGTNTVETAARLLFDAAGTDPEPRATFELLKEIPVGAGLAGGSSDAAAALKLLAPEYAPVISAKRLALIAREVGADVPFFLQAGTCLAEGAGEILTPVSLPFSYFVVIAVPRVSLSTAEVYRLFDEMGTGRDDVAAPTSSFIERSRRWRAASANISDLKTLVDLMQNDLEPAALSLCPEIATIKEELLDAGAAGALMSGSGSAVFALFAGKKTADAAAARLEARGGRAWSVSPVR